MKYTVGKRREVQYETRKRNFVEAVSFHDIAWNFYLWGRLRDRDSDEKKFADEYHWIDETEMLDLIAIAQSAPGAIAVNGSIVVGYKLAGIPGHAGIHTGTILPPSL